MCCTAETGLVRLPLLTSDLLNILDVRLVFRYKPALKNELIVLKSIFSTKVKPLVLSGVEGGDAILTCHLDIVYILQESGICSISNIF